MQLPKNFCIAPFFQHTTHPSGTSSPCPYLGGTVWDNADSTTILEQWNSEGLTQLRQDFLDNKRSDICYRCWNEEDNGKRSLRKRLLDPEDLSSDYTFLQDKTVVEQFINELPVKAYTAGPRALTIKNGNICNAKCRSCHPGDSSRWLNDAKKLNSLTGYRYYNTDSVERNWTDEQVNEIIAMAPELVRLELFGGEPSYNKQVYRIVDEIATSGHADHISIYINTNGSVDLTEKMPKLRYYDNVEIGISLDGVFEQFEYIRHGVDYNTAISNVQRLQAFFDKHGTKYWIDSISTVSILNVFYLPEIKEEVLKILPIAPFWNLLIMPEHLNIQHMPDYIKEQVIAKLGDDEDYAELISVMNQKSNLDYWAEFLDTTSGLDYIRKENFKKTFPKFYAMLNEHDKATIEAYNKIQLKNI